MMTMSLKTITILLYLCFLSPSLKALSTDGILLLSFKYSILNDPSSVLQNWNYNDQTPCSWNGVTCTVQDQQQYLLGQNSNFVPDSMYRVTSLILPNNHLLGSISPSLGSIPYLKHLDLSNNLFNGSLPDNIFNSTQLQVLSLSNNLISGVLSESVKGLVSLQVLNLTDNAFSGRIPVNLTSLKNLTVVSLRSNYFSGAVPSGFNAVEVLDLSSNLLNGSLPSKFGGNHLRYLNLSYNKVSGLISPEFVERLPVNSTLDFSFNNLTGPVPLLLINKTVSSFDGNIGLCGEPLKNFCPIPSSLSTPPNSSIMTTSPAIAVIPIKPNTSSGAQTGNQAGRGNLRPGTITVIAFADFAGLSLLAMVIFYVYKLKKHKPDDQTQTEPAVAKSKHGLTTTHTVEITKSPEPSACNSCLILKGGREQSSTTSDSTGSDSDGHNNEQQVIGAFHRTGDGHLKQNSNARLISVDGETQLELETLLKASACILGTSGPSIVCKAVIEGGIAFAVRRIGAESCCVDKVKEFENIVKGIAKLRHPNLVKVRGFHWGDDEKLVVYDYVSNGSLGSSSIYKKTGTASSSSSSSSSTSSYFPFETRFKIARGLARGLSYIHEKKQVHGNIKPSNILLNLDMEPIITDFGLNHLVRANSKTTRSPYQSPESNNSLKPNPKNDVYSFGVVLLELLAGKVFSVDCAIWTVEEVEKNRVLMLFDATIRGDVVEKEDVVVGLFRLGFSCVGSLPHKRPSMKEVVQVLEKIPLCC